MKKFRSKTTTIFRLKKNIKDFDPKIPGSISIQVAHLVTNSVWSLIWISVANSINDELSALIEDDLQNKL